MVRCFSLPLRGILTVLLPILLMGCSSGGPIPPFEITEIREPCDNYQVLRQPFFGETHVHTSYSFDAYVFSNRNDPDAAYRFAKGEAVPLPDVLAVGGVPQTRSTQLDRPLDFTAITDHAELFGEVQICTRSAPDTPGYDALLCEQIRTEKLTSGGEVNPTAVAGLWAVNPILRPDGAGPLPFCNAPGVDCGGASVSTWLDIQAAAEAHYDRSSACNFTTFVAYEYTSQPEFDNLHRNVIFRNDRVVAAPISNIETEGPNPPKLWDLLQTQCLDVATGCDVLTIPHNANLSGSTPEDPAGRMFPDPRNADEARQRAAFEPLTEILQHKGGSECRYDRLAQQGVQTVDELCTFEQLPRDVLDPSAPAVPIDQYPPRNMVRNALKDGMALAPKYGGVNPFKYGLVGSTDSHNGTPGNTAEMSWPGHAGTDDAPFARQLNNNRLNPGGLAVVWAEENSRDAIFSAMRRKETYGTSGTRPVVRFFGGWDYDTKPGRLCSQPEFVATGYAQGVPMGSDLPQSSGKHSPRFLVAAMKDPGSERMLGTPLQRIQIVKGWVDAQGQTQERVYDVAGNSALQGDELDTATCQVNPEAGFGELCAVWEDPDFDAALPAFYYARILENPTCRWSTFACRGGGVDPFAPQAECLAQAAAADAQALAEGQLQAGETPFNNCCMNEENDAFMSRTIQERAWTSPIWYEAKDT